MKCSALQNRLLELENPEQLPPPFKAHLARCRDCRAWYGRLMQIERNAARLPVPASGRKDSFVRMVLAGEVTAPAARRPASTTPVPGTASSPIRPAVAGTIHRRESSRHKIALATGLAASLALFTLGWAALQWQGSSPTGPARPTPDPLVANLVKYDLKLASAATPRERVQTLAAVAKELHGQAKPLAEAGNVEDLKLLARNYERVLREGVLKHARTVPAGERAMLIEDVAGQLADAGSQSDRDAESAPEERREPLRQMASAAREVRQQLLDLLKEGKT